MKREFFHTRVAVSAAVSLLALAILTGCKTPSEHRIAADAEVYGILNAKSSGVPGMVDDIDIEPVELTPLDGLPVNDVLVLFLGLESAAEVNASIISLESALDIAFSQNRDYQARKEQLYLQALSLTLDRHQFAPIFSGGGSADFVSSTRDVQVTTFVRAVDNMTGTSGAVLQRYASTLEDSGTFTRGTAPASVTTTDVQRERSIEGSTSFGFSMLMRSGAQFAFGLTTSFVDFLTFGGSDSAFSTLSASFVQPLLRDRGRDVNVEFLTQAERDVLYELREFTRFRKVFAITVASAYYNVLRNRDAVRNNYRGLKNFELSLEREQAFQDEGLRTASDVARLEEAKLQRDASWTRSVTNYQRSLDNFKILLGYPTDAAIVLDEDELLSLAERGIQIPRLSSNEAIDIALVTRLDLYTDRDLVDDAERRIKVAANDLKGDLDLVLAGSVGTKDGNRFAAFDFERTVLSAGLDIDLPLDRKLERNNYRRALINYEVAKRAADLSEDTVKLEVRDAWRRLQQFQKDYEINLVSVELNGRRVEEEVLRAELGLGNILDQVDAQNVLTTSQTALTGALVDHTISLLQFWRDIGILYVKKNGQWEDMINA